MSAVTVNSRTYSDDSDPVTGLGNGGHRTRLIPLFSDALTEISNQVLTASQSYRATSTSAVTIGAGSKNFVVTAGKGFAVGDLVLARQASNASNFMAGAVTAFNAATGALTLSVSPGDFGGSGMVSDWVVLGSIGPRGLRGLAGFSYGWDAGTVAGDPGSGLMRANNAALASATALYLDNIDGLGADVSAQLTAWGASTSAVKGRLILRSQTDPTQQIIYDVAAVAAASGYVALAVVYRGGAASFAAGITVDANFSRTGDKGDVANPGQQFQFDAGTTAADPGPGRIRFNNAALSGATAAYVDAIDANGSDVSAWLAALGAGLSVQKGVLRLQSMTTLTKFAEFGVSAAANAAGYVTLSVSYLGPTPPPVFAAGEALALLWSRAGDKGDTGSAGSITNAGDGSVTAPGFAFSAETGLGIRRKGAALAAVAGGGADLLELRPATLAEAQAGSNSLAVMTPERVANAIAALATGAVLPAQAGQAGKVLRTDGSAAAWAFQSGAGGALVSGSVILTASAAAAQAVTPMALGQSVTLPSAMTLGAGAQLYQITNRSDKFQLGIRDAAGKLIEVIAPGGVCDLGLIDVSTAAGQWTANNSAPESMLVTATVTRALSYGSDPGRSYAQLGTTLLYVLGADNNFSNGVYLQAFDGATGTLGAPVLVSTSGRTAFVTALSPTTALCVATAPSGDMSAAVVTVSGSVVSLGTIANATGVALFGSGSSAALNELQALSATAAIGLFSWSIGASYFYSALAFSVSGSTVTIGATRRDLMSGGFQIGTARSLGAPLGLLSATTAVCFYYDSVSYPTVGVYGVVITVSGASLALGTPAGFLFDASNSFVFLRRLASGKYVAGYAASNAFTARAFTVAGTTVAVGAAFNTGATSGAYVMQPFAYDATRLFYFGSVGYGVLQENAGALSNAAGPYAPFFLNSNSQPLGNAVGVVDNYVYFQQSSTAARLQFDGASSVTFDALLPPPRNGQTPSGLFGKVGSTMVFSNLVCMKGRSLVGLGAAQLTGTPSALTVLSGGVVAYWTRSLLNNAWTINVAEVAQ